MNDERLRRPRPVVRTSWSCPLCLTKTVIHLKPRSYIEQIEHCRTCQAMVVLITTFVPQVTVLRVEKESTCSSQAGA